MLCLRATSSLLPSPSYDAISRLPGFAHALIFDDEVGADICRPLDGHVALHWDEARVN